MNTKSLLCSALLAAVSFTYLIACDDSSGIKETAPDAGSSSSTSSSSGGGDSGPSDCFMNPTTHFEIINACTTATKITKNPTLTRGQADGGLPTPM